MTSRGLGVSINRRNALVRAPATVALGCCGYLFDCAADQTSGAVSGKLCRYSYRYHKLSVASPSPTRGSVAQRTIPPAHQHAVRGQVQGQPRLLGSEYNCRNSRADERRAGGGHRRHHCVSAFVRPIPQSPRPHQAAPAPPSSPAHPNPPAGYRVLASRGTPHRGRSSPRARAASARRSPRRTR
jgi:hypothetical protein